MASNPHSQPENNVQVDPEEQSSNVRKSVTFLDLPAEIRNDIYTLYLQAHKHPLLRTSYGADRDPTHNLGCGHHSSHKPLPTICRWTDDRMIDRRTGNAYGALSKSPPPLTRTSRQIRAEVLPMFYTENPFLCYLVDKSDIYTVRRWLKELVGTNAKHIQNIRIIFRKRRDRKTVEVELVRFMRLCGIPSDGRLSIERLSWKVSVRCCEICVWWKVRQMLAHG